jgi:glycosyltransferase involved in cell wall biosynthesis
VRIVFYDRTPVDYTAETPLQRALGGSESALCYLSIELARLGHSVALITNTSAPGNYLGVECSNHRDAGTNAILAGADVIVNSNEALGRFLRDNLRVTKPLVLWIQHAHDQPAIKGLESSRERRMWNGYAFVSRWQLDEFADRFWVPPEKSRVMRNAVAPAFANLDPPQPWFMRGDAPLLFYTSTPYRGLDILLNAIPTIRAAVSDVRLRVFSGFAASYGTKLEDDPYRALYERCRSTEGVDYVGPLAQPDLLNELSRAAALAYPSIFAETSCIAVLEAMAAGALILTTRLGALEETTAGFARLITVSRDPVQLANAFAALTIDALQETKRNPEAALAHRESQIAYIKKNYTWPVRALEWQAWLTELAAA